jgi:hypothetical protein
LLHFIWRWRSHELFSQAGLELWSSWSQPLRYLGLQTWATSVLLRISIFKSTIQRRAFTYHCSLPFEMKATEAQWDELISPKSQSQEVPEERCKFQVWLTLQSFLFLTSAHQDSLVYITTYSVTINFIFL